MVKKKITDEKMVRGSKALRIMLNSKTIKSGELHAIIDNLVYPFAIFEQFKNDGVSDLVCSYINKSGLDDIQLTEEEVIGKKLKEIFPKNSQTLLQVCSQVIKDNVPRKSKYFYSVVSGNLKEEKAYDISISKLNDSVALSWALLNEDKNKEELPKRKTENEVLQNADELFIKTFHANPDGFIISRMSDGKILEINRSAEILFQYSKDEMIGRTSAELGLIANLNDRETAISLLKENGFVRDFTMAVVRKSGEIRQVSLAIEIIDVGDEKLMMTSVRDITERKRMEDALYESEKRYRSTLDNMMEGCAIIGFNWIYLYVNEANAKHAFRKPEEMIGRSMFEIIPGVEKSIFFDAYKRCMEERKVQQVEAGFTFEDGTEAWYQAIAQPVPEGIFVISADITERKKAEEELKKSQHILSLILDHVNVGIIVSDAPDGKAIAISRWGANYTIGRSVDAILDLPVESYLEQWDVRDINTREKIQPERLPVFRALKGEVIKGEEILILQPDGTDFIILANAVPIYNEDKSRIVNVISTWTDITSRKKAEKALQKSEHRFRTLFTASSEVLYRMSPDWSEIIQLNGRGFLVDTENPNPNWLQEYIHPDDQQQVISAIKKAILNKSPFELEHRVRQLDGGWGWTFSRAVPLMDADGKIIEWFGAAADFTKRKQAEEALRTSEAQLDAFFANSPAILNLVDEDFCYINTDKLTPTYYGLNRETIKGKCVQDLSRDFMEQTGGVMQRVIQTGVPVLDAEFQSPVPGRAGEMAYWRTSFFRVPLGREKWGVGVISIEVTDIVRSEVKLRESEEKFSKAFVVNPSALIISRIEDGLIIDVNEAFLKIFGYTRDEVIGKTYSDLKMTKPEERDIVIDQLSKKGFLRDVEVKMRRKDGEERIGQFSIETINTSGGKAILSSIQDITERKKAEEAVRKAKEQYDLLFNSINEGFAHYNAVYDANGRLYDLLVLEINPAGAALSGIKREEQIGKTWKEQWTGIEDSLFDIYREVDSTGEPYFFEHFSGITKRWYTNRIYKIASDQFAVTFFDITERKIAEEALKESQAKLLDAQKLAHFGNYSLDIRNNKIEWSDELYNIWELDNNKPVPSFEELWNLIHPDDREHLKKILTQEIKNDSQVKTEFRILFPDKRIKYVELITRIFFDEAGNPVKRQGVEIDITEKKEAMLELERTLKELELSNRDIEQYTYVTSHDLKEPVRMMSSYAQLLEKKYKNKMGHSADLYLNFIREGASRLYLLINDLVNYLQIGNTDRNFVQTDINKIIYSVEVSLNQTLKETGTDVLYNELPVISADPQQMKQLFYNLIDNAIKFRSNNQPVIEIKCLEDDKEWFFSIKDNGIGFKQEYSEIIFSVFQRLNSREDYKGNGVGLAICKRIIGHHNGKIWVESEQGVGSIFYFTIPKTKRFYESKEGS